MPKNHFDAKKHEYTSDGKRLISVTECLDLLDDFSFVDPDVLKKKGTRGTNVHNMVAKFEDGTLQMHKLTESMKKLLKQYLFFRKQYADIFTGKIKIETPIYNPLLGLAGTPDILTPRIFTDIKTRPIHRIRDCLQMAGYEIALGHKKERDYYVLELAEDKFKFTKVYYKNAKAIFLKLLKHKKERVDLINFCKHEEQRGK